MPASTACRCSSSRSIATRPTWSTPSTDGVRLLQALATENVRLLADLFHMNIEEVDLPAAIRARPAVRSATSISSIPTAGPAGCGHTDFAPIAAALREIGYDGYVSAEALPYPNPDEAASLTIQAYRKYLRGAVKERPLAQAPADPSENQRGPRPGRPPCQDPHRRRQLSGLVEERPNAELVCLNLSPGVVTCAQVLAAVLSAIPIEAANTMGYEKTGPYALTEDPPVWDEFRHSLRRRRAEIEAGTDREMGLLQGGRHAGPRADDSDRRPAALRQPAADRRRAHGLRASRWNADRSATRA